MLKLDENVIFYIYICICRVMRMVSKTISVTEEVYDLLDKEKLPGESFSETLTRLVKDKGAISDIAGAWADLTVEESTSIERGMDDVRKSANKRVQTS